MHWHNIRQSVLGGGGNILSFHLVKHYEIVILRMLTVLISLISFPFIKRNKALLVTTSLHEFHLILLKLRYEIILRTMITVFNLGYSSPIKLALSRCTFHDANVIRMSLLVFQPINRLSRISFSRFSIVRINCSADKSLINCILILMWYFSEY